MFSKVQHINKSATELNTDLEKISQWAYQWKMQFNLDPSKQKNKVIFSYKLISNYLLHPPVKFNNNNVTRCSYQKHLGIALDRHFNGSTHIDQKLKLNFPHNASFKIFQEISS